MDFEQGRKLLLATEEENESEREDANRTLAEAAAALRIADVDDDEDEQVGTYMTTLMKRPSRWTLSGFVRNPKYKKQK